MEIHSDLVSITQNSFTKNLPFKLGELIHGKVLEKLDNGFYLIQIKNYKFKAQYAENLNGEHLFKVLENSDKLLLQLVNPKTSQSSHQGILKQLSMLSQYSSDPMLNSILDYYIKFNLQLNQKEILFIFNYFKQNKKKWNPSQINNLLLYRSKGFKLTKDVIERFLSLDDWTNQLEKELQLALKQNDIFSKDLLKKFFLFANSRNLANEIKSLLQRYSKMVQNTNIEVNNITSKNNENFLIEMLKFLAKNQDNKLISKLVRQLLIEKESFILNDAEEDQVFFTLPLIFNDEEASLFKIKIFPKSKKKNCYQFIFDLNLSELGQIRAYCQIVDDELNLHFYLTKERSVQFLKDNFGRLFQSIQEQPLKLGSYRIDYQSELEPFFNLSAA